MWKAAVNHLMGTASLVAMDLRGFGPHRRGCVYELETLLDTVPLDRLVFMIDWSTDRKGLEAILVAHWQRLAADSPNLVAGAADAAAARRRRRRRRGGARVARDRRAAGGGGTDGLSLVRQAHP